jgi:hypothetical protein
MSDPSGELSQTLEAFGLPAPLAQELSFCFGGPHLGDIRGDGGHSVYRRSAVEDGKLVDQVGPLPSRPGGDELVLQWRTRLSTSRSLLSASRAAPAGAMPPVACPMAASRSTPKILARARFMKT